MKIQFQISEFKLQTFNFLILLLLVFKVFEHHIKHLFGTKVTQ